MFFVFVLLDCISFFVVVVLSNVLIAVREGYNEKSSSFDYLDRGGGFHPTTYFFVVLNQGPATH